MAETLREIVLPETRPETEWLRGRAVQKVSPLRPHSRLQTWWVRRLSDWAEKRGEVGSEWRFRVAPRGEAIRPLVPDVAYLSYERMGDATADELAAPPASGCSPATIRSSTRHSPDSASHSPQCSTSSG